MTVPEVHALFRYHPVYFSKRPKRTMENHRIDRYLTLNFACDLLSSKQEGYPADNIIQFS
jgi:hypothetical protein